MRIYLAFFIVLLCSSKLFGVIDYAQIDLKSSHIPDSLKTAKQISSYLIKDLSNDSERVRAFYVWIASNIYYDFENRNTNKRFETKDHLIEDVLRSRKGLCEQYSELFNLFCQYSGIKSFVVRGYVRNGQNQISDIAHAWNAVRIESKFYCIDVTWASGYSINGVYLHQFLDDFFLIEPDRFVKTHLPFDPVWQFSDNPITIFEFNTQNFSKLSEKSISTNYCSLIAQIEKQDRLGYLEHLNKRLLGLDELTDLLLDEIKENAFQIIFEKGKLAKDFYNIASDNYNYYIKQKNLRFHNVEDAKLLALINDIERPLCKADSIFRNLFTFNPDIRSQISEFLNSIQEFKEKIKTENVFIDKYLKTKPKLRFLQFI